MTMLKAVAVLQAEVLIEGDGVQRPIQHVMASDLMSDVLLVDEEDMLLLTSLASDQVLRTAQIVGAVGVVIVNGKPLPSSMPKVAKDLGMTLAVSHMTKYEACIAVHQALTAS